MSDCNIAKPVISVQISAHKDGSRCYNTNFFFTIRINQRHFNERLTEIFEMSFRKFSVPFDFEPEFSEILVEWNAPLFLELGQYLLFPELTMHEICKNLITCRKK